MLLLVFFIPSAISLTCHYKPEPDGALSTCTGDACVYLVDFRMGGNPSGIQGCINNLNVTVGCTSYPKINICVCTTDLCNTKMGEDRQSPKNSTCPTTLMCTEILTCMFTTDNTIESCMIGGDIVSLHEFFTNTVFIDQTFIPSNKKSKSAVTTVCDNDKCMKLAKKLSTQKNFTSANSQVRCYSYQDEEGKSFELNINPNKTANNQSCTGDLCYMSRKANSLGDEIIRGCLTVMDDSLAVRPVESGTYSFVKLQFYICKGNYCNLNDVDTTKNGLPTVTTTTMISITSRDTGLSTTINGQSTVSALPSIDTTTTAAPAATESTAVVIVTTIAAAQPTTSSGVCTFNVLPLVLSTMCLMRM